MNEFQTQQKEKSIHATMRDILGRDEVKNALSSASGKWLTPERLAEAALTAINKVPKLAECSPASLLAAVKTLAQMGCEPDGVHGYLVPFLTKVTQANGKEEWMQQAMPVPSARGLLRMAHQSGIKGLYVGCVTSEELKSGRFEWKVENGELCVRHLPDLLAPAPADGEVSYALYYVLWRDAQGERQGVYMTRREAEKVMLTSKSYDTKTGQVKGPWRDWFDEMAKKTVIKRAAKQWDMPLPLQNALEAADEQEFNSSLRDVTPRERARAEALSRLPRREADMLFDMPADAPKASMAPNE